MSIQVFGVELRRANNLSSLYKDVDIVLQKNSTDYRLVPYEVKYGSVANALEKMFKVENHFSVCTIQEAAKVAQIVIPKERMDIYNLQHCIHWNEMIPEFRTKLIAMVLDDFRDLFLPQEKV